MSHGYESSVEQQTQPEAPKVNANEHNLLAAAYDYPQLMPPTVVEKAAEPVAAAIKAGQYSELESLFEAGLKTAECYPAGLNMFINDQLRGTPYSVKEVEHHHTPDNKEQSTVEVDENVYGKTHNIDQFKVNWHTSI